MVSRNWIATLLSCLLLIAMLSGGGCFSTPLNTVPENKTDPPGTKELPPGEIIKVVATIFPLADIVSQIGKEAVEVTTLLSPGASPHTYEPTVEQARAIADSGMLVFVGGGLDDWAMKPALANEKLAVLKIMDCLDDEQCTEYGLLPSGESFGPEENYQGDRSPGLHTHSHGARDPHVWMDPLLVKDLIVPLLTEQLKTLFPEKAAYFQDNRESFEQKLEALHAEVSALAASFSEKRFISYHSAWNYFARRYGLEEVAAVEDSPGKEPSAKWLSELVALADLHDIRVIFAEVQLGTRVAEIIAKEIDGRVLLLDPLGGKGLDGREDYLQLMRYNARIFQEALQ